jgi:hypothetical protein
MEDIKVIKEFFSKPLNEVTFDKPKTPPKSKVAENLARKLKESVNEGNSTLFTDKKTGKTYDIQKNGRRWEMDIMKPGASIYSKSITIKRTSPSELKDWLDGYKIDSSWMNHLVESVNESKVTNSEILDVIDSIQGLIKNIKGDDSKESSKLFSTSGPLIKELHKLVESVDK